jgi:hypothetical protein
MCPAINNPTSCHIRAVIRFLCAKNMSDAEIHRELCAVYGQNIKNEGTVRQWCRMIKDRRKMFMMKSEVVGRPSVVSDDLVQSVDENICESRRFTISKVSCEFPQISLTILYQIITARLGYHKFCATWVPEMLMGAH